MILCKDQNLKYSLNLCVIFTISTFFPVNIVINLSHQEETNVICHFTICVQTRFAYSLYLKLLAQSYKHILSFCNVSVQMVFYHIKWILFNNL